MQISTNPFMRESPLAYQTTQKQQESESTFDVLLSRQTNAISESQEEREAQTYGDIYSDLFQQFLNGEIDGDAWQLASAASLTASLVEAYQKYGWNNGNLFSKMKGVHQERVKADTSSEITTEIHKDILALNHNIKGSETSSGKVPQYIFEAQKSEVMDIFSTILQDIQA